MLHNCRKYRMVFYSNPETFFSPNSTDASFEKVYWTLLQLQKYLVRKRNWLLQQNTSPWTSELSMSPQSCRMFASRSLKTSFSEPARLQFTLIWFRCSVAKSSTLTEILFILSILHSYWNGTSKIWQYFSRARFRRLVPKTSGTPPSSFVVGANSTVTAISFFTKFSSFPTVSALARRNQEITGLLSMWHV